MHARAIKTWAPEVGESEIPVQTRIRRNATTAITNITAASMARIPSSKDTVCVTALNNPTRKQSVVYVNGLARLAHRIAASDEHARKHTDDMKRRWEYA